MTTTLHPQALAEGTLVRLSVDTGHASIGQVVDVSHTRDDGTVFYRVDFRPDPDLPGAIGCAIVCAAPTLVPVCEHEDTDGWGLACSEPGVPTSFTVSCRFDAERVVTYDDRWGSASLNLCDEHAREYAIAMTEDDDVTRLSVSPIR